MYIYTLKIYDRDRVLRRKTGRRRRQRSRLRVLLLPQHRSEVIILAIPATFRGASSDHIKWARSAVVGGDRCGCRIVQVEYYGAIRDDRCAVHLEEKTKISSSFSEIYGEKDARCNYTDPSYIGTKDTCQAPCL